MLGQAFIPCRLPAEAEELRPQVREFLATALADYGAASRAYSWMGFDVAFTRALGQRGWIGLTWPREYGFQCRWG